MTDNKVIDPYETVCQMKKNDEAVRLCNEAIEAIEQIGHLIFRLQSNDAFRGLEPSIPVGEWSKSLSEASSKLYWNKAEIMAKNASLHWDLKYVRCDGSEEGKDRWKTYVYYEGLEAVEKKED